MSRRTAPSHPNDPDADLFRDDDDEISPATGSSSKNPYASSTRWRHQESSSYAKHAARQQQQQQQQQGGGSGHGHAVARDADSHGRVNELADFLNTSRISPDETTERPTTPRYKPIVEGAAEARQAVNGENADGDPHLTQFGGAKNDGELGPPDGKEVACGPLINYRRMEGNQWVGSVLVVTRGGGRTQLFKPTLNLRRAGGGDERPCETICLYSDSRNTFWRFNLTITMEAAETKWEYELPELRFLSKSKPRVNSFFVPAITESMRIMFHSCNGFSVGTDEDAWSGAALWNDVMRKHREAPFHVM